MFIRSKGKIRCGNKSVVVDIDDQIREYYYSLIPKYYGAQRQMYAAHITVVRGLYQQYPRCMREVVDGREVSFEYENVVRFDGLYFFLTVYSQDIGKIRQSFGLTFYPHIFTCFHTTVGNIKNDDVAIAKRMV
jgi:hypothetical protein